MGMHVSTNTTAFSVTRKPDSAATERGRTSERTTADEPAQSDLLRARDGDPTAGHRADARNPFENPEQALAAADAARQSVLQNSDDAVDTLAGLPGRNLVDLLGG